jgi:cellulose synthase operon protein C
MTSCASHSSRPTSKVRVNADFDAAALLINTKQWDRAIVVLEGFRRNFPQSPLQPTSRASSRSPIRNRTGRARPRASSNRSPHRPGESVDVQREATLQAAELYDKAGNTPKARTMLEAFVKHFPQPLNPAMEARNKLRLIATKTGDIAAQDYWLQGDHRGRPQPPAAPAPTAAARSRPRRR